MAEVERSLRKLLSDFVTEVIKKRGTVPKTVLNHLTSLTPTLHSPLIEDEIDIDEVMGDFIQRFEYYIEDKATEEKNLHQGSRLLNSSDNESRLETELERKLQLDNSLLEKEQETVQKYNEIKTLLNRYRIVDQEWHEYMKNETQLENVESERNRMKLELLHLSCLSRPQEKCPRMRDGLNKLLALLNIELITHKKRLSQFNDQLARYHEKADNLEYRKLIEQHNTLLLRHKQLTENKRNDV